MPRLRTRRRIRTTRKPRWTSPAPHAAIRGQSEESREATEQVVARYPPRGRAGARPARHPPSNARFLFSRSVTWASGRITERRRTSGHESWLEPVSKACVGGPSALRMFIWLGGERSIAAQARELSRSRTLDYLPSTVHEVAAVSKPAGPKQERSVAAVERTRDALETGESAGPVPRLKT
jgi:hypothetical protein